MRQENVELYKKVNLISQENKELKKKVLVWMADQTKIIFSN